MWNWILSNKEIVLSLSTVTISVIAIVISIYQVQLSNKHHLFNRRVNLFKIIDCLFSTIDKFNITQDYLKEQLQFDDNITLFFIRLTSNRYLEEIALTIKNPTDEDSYKIFMNKQDEMESLTYEAEFSFPKKESRYIKNFLTLYCDLLRSIQCYKVLKLSKIGNTKAISICEILRLEDDEKLKNAIIEEFLLLKQLCKEINSKKIKEKIFKDIKL